MTLSSADQIHLLPLLLFLVLLPNSTFAQNKNGNVIVGTSLSATENSSPWLSPSGDFAFGFRLLRNQRDPYLLCIWYDKIPDKTIIWYANGNPTAALRGSKVSLTSDHGLVLTNPQGQELWRSETVFGDVSKGVMSDKGNFLLQDISSKTLWETFKYPTDTMLPSQIMDRGGTLSSRQSETSFTRGRSQLRLQQDGNVALNTTNLPTEFASEPYFATMTDEGSNLSTSGPVMEPHGGKQLVLSKSVDRFILGEDGQRLRLAQGDIVSARDYYFRTTLSFDGVFTLYYHPIKSGNGTLTFLWSIPDNICHNLLVFAGAGVCGYNSICTLKDEERRPKCACPQKYSLVDPNDSYGNCKPDFVRGCEEDELVSSKGGDILALYDVVEVIDQHGLADVGLHPVEAFYWRFMPRILLERLYLCCYYFHRWDLLEEEVAALKWESGRQS